MRKPRTDARLTDEAVRRIRFGSESLDALAADYGLSHVAIWKVRNFRTYKAVMALEAA